MCQLIYLGSVEPLPESSALGVYRVAGPGQMNSDLADLHAVLPEARYLYQLGGCQCHFRYYPEAEIADATAGEPTRGDKKAADSSRRYLEGRNAFMANTADYLADNLGRTPIWMVWKWEGQPLSPDCVRWGRTPSYFRQHDFTMPEDEGVITLLPD